MQYDQKSINEIRSQAIILNNQSSDYDSLLQYIDDAQIVLLGEATHGTHEFYTIRSQISQRLIQEKGFHAIAVEGDWPDVYQINRYVHAQQYKQATEALASFDRFPTWMWRNVPMVQLIQWLHDYNQHNKQAQVGFYGLDIYSLYRSIDIVIESLKKIDPGAAAQAQYHYSCFEPFRPDPQAYSYAVYTRAIASCASMVGDQLERLQKQEWEYLGRNEISAEQVFYVEQNARVIKNAENYYRSLFSSEDIGWNIRDSHMMETLKALIAYYRLKGIERPKIIIWAHNSHIGNAAATQMSSQGEYNIGQLAKEHFKSNAVSVGFTTYDGTVSAATDWHGSVERKRVRTALPGSYEDLFHTTTSTNFLLLLNNVQSMPRLLERAIGVIYRPETERLSHYFYADIKAQFDAVIHCDRTVALEPLEKTTHWIAGETPETYPSGL